MRIKRITIQSFLGARSVDLRCEAPVVLVCGANGAGKSSVRDGVALALTADLGRVGLKKEAVQLISAGADLASVQVTDADGEIFAVSINSAGKITDSLSGRSHAPVLEYVLDAQRFAQLDATARRGFLFELMSLRADGAAITERLLARGLDHAKVERVAPLLRAGFDGACKEAKSQATQAKGAWRAVTGEAYGSEKAKSWRAPVPAVDAIAEQQLAAELAQADEAVESWQKMLGRLEAEAGQRSSAQARLADLQERAGRLERVRTKLATDEAELQRLDGEMEPLRGAAGAGKRYGLVHDLAHAADFLRALQQDSTGVAGYHLNGAVAAWSEFEEFALAMTTLEAYEKAHGPLNATGGDPAAAARLAELEKARAIVQRAVENDRRDLEAAQRAQVEAEGIAAELDKPHDPLLLPSTRGEADGAKARRAELVKKADAIKAQRAAAGAAEKRTADAAAHAADVAAWDAIADALAPDGIPAELLAAALTPINDRLVQSAEDTGWPVVFVHEDMRITANLREYRLLSESERWRADAMLAEAIAHVSGTRLLVLDRMDVLDLHGRGQLLGWLDLLADNGEIDTALVFATLKSMPAGLPETVRAHWIESGVLAAQLEPA